MIVEDHGNGIPEKIKEKFLSRSFQQSQRKSERGWAFPSALELLRIITEESQSTLWMENIRNLYLIYLSITAGAYEVR